MVNQKFTVIIPTRERCEVLWACLKTVTAQEYENLEIIVSDNVSADATVDVVRSICDPRIKYINPGRRLSMSHHWEFALSHVSDGWVAIIGDDDGLMPNAISKVAGIVDSSDTKLVRSGAAWYRWPSMTGTAYGRMGVPLGSSVSIKNSQDSLKKVLKGHGHYMDLPMLYTGTFAHLSAINKARNIAGHFFASNQPDIYSALALASVESTFLFLAEPLALAGLSGRSNGASFLYGTKPAAGKPAEHELFFQEDIIPFHVDIPLDVAGMPPKSIQVLVFESWLQSLHLRGASEYSTYQEQLAIILATSGKNRDNVEEWAIRFAIQHALDINVARQRAAHFKYRAAIPTMETRWRHGVDTSEVGSKSIPIRDVYEASIVAAAIRGHVPGRTRNALSYLKRTGLRIGAHLLKSDERTQD